MEGVYFNFLWTLINSISSKILIWKKYWQWYWERKNSKKTQTSSNSSKATGNVYFMKCIKLIFIDIVSLILFFFLIFYHDDCRFVKQSFIKSWLFYRGYEKLSTILNIEYTLNIEHSINVCVLLSVSYFLYLEVTTWKC